MTKSIGIVIGISSVGCVSDSVTQQNSWNSYFRTKKLRDRLKLSSIMRLRSARLAWSAEGWRCAITIIMTDLEAKTRDENID